MKIKTDYSHTIGGLFWFDLPLGLLLAFIFHNIVRDSLFNNLPTIFKSRISTFKRFDWNSYFKTNWLVVITSVLIGASSHLFWDSFTRDNGYFVKTIPVLTNTFEVFGRQIPIFKIVKHSSSLVGGFIIIYALFKIPADQNVNGKLNLRYWIVFTALTLTIIAIRLLSGLDLKFYEHIIVTGMSAGLIALTLTPLIIRQKE